MMYFFSIRRIASQLQSMYGKFWYQFDSDLEESICINVYHLYPEILALRDMESQGRDQLR